MQEDLKNYNNINRNNNRNMPNRSAENVNNRNMSNRGTDNINNRNMSNRSTDNINNRNMSNRSTDNINNRNMPNRGANNTNNRNIHDRELDNKRSKTSSRDRVLLVLIILLSIAAIILASFLIYLKLNGNIDGDYIDAMSNETENTISKEEAEKIINDALVKYSVMEDLNQEQLAELAELCRNNYEALPVIENYSVYPERVIKMLLVSTETMEFLLNYPDKIGQPVDENIDISGDYTEGEIPLFLQWDQRWGYYEYGSGVIGYTACGPTCLSMIYTYFTGDLTYNPLKMTQFSRDNDYYENGVGTRWTLMTTGASQLGLSSKQISNNEEKMVEELSNGHPLIVSVGPGDFTDNGHFIVIREYKNGSFYVNDPNSIRNSNSEWSYEELKSQIKAIWTFWKE